MIDSGETSNVELLCSDDEGASCGRVHPQQDIKVHLSAHSSTLS